MHYDDIYIGVDKKFTYHHEQFCALLRIPSASMSTYASVVANAPWIPSHMMPLRNVTSQISAAAVCVLDHLRGVDVVIAAKGMAALAVGVVVLANVRGWPFYWHCESSLSL